MYPKRVDRFIQWTKDMVQGATVDRPRLTTRGRKGRAQPQKWQKRRRRRKRKTHGSKD